MFSSLKRLRGQLVPSPSALTIVWVAVAGLATCSALSVFMDLTTQEDSYSGVSALIISVFVLPAFALLLIAGALREKRFAPRAWMWGLAAGAVGTAGVILSGSMLADPTLDSAAPGAFLLIICSPLVILLSIPVVYFLARAWPELAQALKADRSRRATDMILARGEISFSELAGELHMDLGDVDNLVDGLLRSGQLMGLMDAPRQVVYSAAALAEKQRRLLGVVHARGQIHLDALAAELRAPRGLLKDWIYQLVQRGQFSGYINWEEGLLYSADAQALRDQGRCPRCGGELGLAGKGVILCSHCGSEIFL